jgi:hypothetical protein
LQSMQVNWVLGWLWVFMVTRSPWFVLGGLPSLCCGLAAGGG